MSKKPTANADHPPRYLLVSEVCQILRLSKTTVYKMFKRKKLKSLKFEGRTVVSRIAFNQYLTRAGERPLGEGGER